MATSRVKKTNAKEGLRNGIATFLLYGLGLFFASLALPLATGLSFPIVLFTLGSVSLIFLFISKGKMTFFLTANLIFLPGLLLVMNQDARRDLGSVAWSQAMGGLVVAVWVAGLLYIVLASLVRLFGLKTMHRYFLPRFVGPALMVTGLTSLPFLLEDTVLSPIRDAGVSSYKSWILFGVSLAVTLLFYFNKKTRKFFRLAPAFVGLASGLATAFLLDGIELLFLSKDIASTLLFAPLSEIPDTLPLFIFQDLETYFGFWSYLHFDWNALIAIVPLVLIAFGYHWTTIERLDDTANTDIAQLPGMDRTFVGEGICTMVSGLLAGMPVTVSGGNETFAKKTNPWPLIASALLLMMGSLFAFLGYVQNIFPPAVVGGTLIGILLSLFRKGLTLAFAPSALPFKHSWVFPALILFIGVILSVFFFLQSVFRLWDNIFIPGGITLAPLSIIALVAFIANGVLPWKRPSSKTDASGI